MLGNSKMRIYILFLVSFSILLTNLFTLASPARAETLTSTTKSVSVGPDEATAKLEYALPSSVTLGSGDSVNWQVTDLVTHDTEGNISSELLDRWAHGPLSIDLNPVGRRANLNFTSDFAGEFLITVTAKVNNTVYTNTQTVTFTVGPKRTPMTYLGGKAPTITYESPDVGNDLQTVVRFKVNWTRTPNPAGMPDGPYWVYMWTVDSKGDLVRQPWGDANPSTRIFWDDPQLNQTLPTGTDWINLPVTYKNWRDWGGVHVKVWWSITDPQKWDHYIYFEKTFDIPINFPKSKPSLSTVCNEVYDDENSSCKVSLSYKDPLGNPATGPEQQISWKLLDGTKVISSGLSEHVKADETFSVDLPPGKNPLVIESTILGTDVISQSTANAHDYVAALISSLSLGKDCPESFKGSTFKCQISFNASTKKPFKVNVILQERVDGSAWKTVKKIELLSNTSVSVALPANNKKSLSFRATMNYLGETISSDTQDWVKDSPKATPPTKSGGTSATPTVRLSAGDKKACSYYKSAMAQGLALPFGSSKLHYILSAGYQAAMIAATNPTLKLDFRILLDSSNGSGIDSSDALIEVYNFCN
jgi:plastocyanin